MLHQAKHNERHVPVLPRLRQVAWNIETWTSIGTMIARIYIVRTIFSAEFQDSI